MYEEEVFSSDSALWWSPDSSTLAFMSFDETAVDTYEFPLYNPGGSADEVHPYTQAVKMKYPKPGTNNPIVSLHLFDVNANGNKTTTTELTWDARRPKEDSVITEVTWVSNRTLVVKEVNRAADDGSVVLFDLDSTSFVGGKGRKVRALGKNGEQGDDGWIDAVRLIFFLFFFGRLMGDGIGTNDIPTPTYTGLGRSSRLPGHRTLQRRIQPHRAVQPARLGHAQVAHDGRVGGRRRDQGRRSAARFSVRNFPLSFLHL